MYQIRKRLLLPKTNMIYIWGMTKADYTTITTGPASGSRENGEIIVLPKRIQRSPTDLLQALASTVGRDSTAPHFKYHDDPFLIPMSNVAKRTYAMSKEAGRKAANWIKEEHRELFMHQEAQPPIKKFSPRLIFTKESEVDEHILKELIGRGELSDAVFVYKLLEKNGMQLSVEVKQSLLEMVCFFNNQEPLPEENIEERWFLQNNRRRDRGVGKTWKDGEFAETLYAAIEPKTSQAYATLIRGMAKYLQCERAYALLQEAGERKIKLDTNTFNAIIQIVSLLKDTAEQRWQLTRDLLEQMAQQQLLPNLDTLNALLECISTFGNFKLARKASLQVLAEFKKLNVKLSLGSYYYLLIIFCRERGPVSHVIVDILNEISDKEFLLEHPKDTYFFATAMDVCRNHLHDKILAKKINDLLHKGNNYDLIGDSFKESVYYRHFLALLCQTETMEDFMLTYDQLVPNVYIPEPGIMEEILRSIEINGAVEHIPRIWSDMVIFDHTHRESLLLYILRIMAENDKPDNEQLIAQCSQVALDMYQRIEEQAATAGNRNIRKNFVSFTGQMLGDILSLIVRSRDISNFEQASNVFNYIDKNQHSIPGTPSDQALQEYVQSCIKFKAPSQSLLVLQYAVENNMESSKLAEIIYHGFTLNEVHLAKLKTLVGDMEFLVEK